MANLIETTESNFEEQVLKSDVICCVYFNAAWCKTGMELTDTVKAAADDVGDKMKFCEVNTDRQGQIVRSMAVRTIPTVHFVKQGKTVDQLRGAVSKLDLLGKISAVLTEHGGDGEDEPAASEPTDETDTPDTPSEVTEE
jgi:thioredoxin 1